jgi:tagaturonate reductase
VEKQKKPVRILQYGEGNFLRAFADWMVDIANERGAFDGSVVVIKPIEYGSVAALKEAGCEYTVLLRGRLDGEDYSEARRITCIADALDAYSDYESYAAYANEESLRFIISNTTEAGIVYDETDRLELNPPNSYPGKLTKFLYERWNHFNGAADKGLIILPAELIENNGGQLLSCCVRLSKLWGLPETFIDWLNNDNHFCRTLVDRIVTGYPKDEAEAIEAELGYSDKLLVTGEPFALWVIESDKPDVIRDEFPLDKAGLPVIFTDNLKPYRERKVRLLNGAHTSTALAAYLSALDTVGDIMADPVFREYLNRVLAELKPYVPLPQEEVEAFANSVIDRFSNPYIKHSLLSISLNSVSKFKARVLPTILETYDCIGKLPDALCFAFAALVWFYIGDVRDGRLYGTRIVPTARDDEYEILDDKAVIKFFIYAPDKPTKEFVTDLFAQSNFWGQDLNLIPGLNEKVVKYILLRGSYGKVSYTLQAALNI